MDEEKSLGESCGMLLLGLAVSPFTSYWQGFVVWKLAHWFIVPVVALPPLLPIHIAGGLLAISTMRTITKRSDATMADAIAYSLAGPLVYLTIGYMLALLGGLA